MSDFETASNTYRLQGSLDGVRQVFDLEPGVYTLGSARTSTLIVPHASVSRQHARLRVDAGGLEIEDLGSTNGTFLDGEAVRRGRAAAGSRLRFGRVRFEVLRAEREDARLAIVLEEEAGTAEPGRGEASTAALPAETSREAAARFPGLAFPPGYLPGRAPAMLALYEEAARLVRGDPPVLILGETGTGKEWIARLLHASSPRWEGPFVAINCAAIPAEQLEAEMFGVARGAATGVEARRGRLEEASGGTLLLDEIGEMPPALQAKLLRALQEGEVRPLGGQARRVDPRILAATHADVEQSLEAGTLRADLFYRLAGGRLRIPPLRERREDIPALVEHFLRSFAAESGIRPRGLTVAALERLRAHPWPGNVRQLEHEIRRLVYGAAPGSLLDVEQLSEGVRAARGGSTGLERAVAELESLDLPEAVRLLETELIRRALERSGGNKSRAARLLGLSRNGLKQKIRRLDLA